MPNNEEIEKTDNHLSYRIRKGRPPAEKEKRRVYESLIVKSQQNFLLTDVNAVLWFIASHFTVYMAAGQRQRQLRVR